MPARREGFCFAQTHAPAHSYGVCKVSDKSIPQDAINERAGNAHWQAYGAALKAGKTAAQAMQEAEAARRKANEAVSRG